MTVGPLVIAAGLLLFGQVDAGSSFWTAVLPAGIVLGLGLFGSRQFTGANLTTLAVYAGLGAATFLVVLQLQVVLGYSPVEAGASLLPLTVLMLLLSSHFGALSQRVGPRLPMTVGPLVIAVGLLLFGQVDAGSSFWTSVLPAGIVLGLGLSITVAPLTSTVLGAVDEEHLGIASGVNNAVARLAGLLAVAVLPGVVGLDLASTQEEFSEGFGTGMVVAACLCLVGGLVAFLTVRSARPTDGDPRPLEQPCLDPSRLRPASAGAGSSGT